MINIKTKLLLLSSSLTILLTSGCSTTIMEPEINFEPPVYVEQMEPMQTQQEFASSGSIFGQGDNPLFADHKAMHVNDIVTVTISETANSTNTANKALTESDVSNLGGGVFTSGGGGFNAGGINSATNASFAANSTSAYTGAGSYTKNATFSTTVSARIIKVLKNGNYFISGSREILIDEQKQTIQVSGVIRPYDINQNNQVNSSQIGDAKISYRSDGDIKRASQQGWGSRLVHALWPF